ncbi:MAG: tetratricopeptide repeat protein [Pseudomonadota bacterium]
MSCHSEEYENWRGSHHDLAMQLPNNDTVLGDFEDATFTYGDVTTRFYKKDDKFWVQTDGEDGTLQDFPVEYVFGVYPLQQYLLPLSRGRLQALTIAWDSRPESDGGQRWYHLYPDEVIASGDPLHWTGPYMNWNTRCAECHSTDLVKNYDLATRSFATTYEEINVGCEGCHGPGETHIQLAKAGKLGTVDSGGFATDFAHRGQWQFAEGDAIAKRTEPLHSRAQVDNCGRCHARRGTLGDYHYGQDLLATHRVALPTPPLYHYDGQVLDENYVYGSFLQSKMHQAGVVCSNCHEPHSLALRAPGNAICAQCHRADVFDTPQHHHHKVDTAGALCANCHMPETVYMGIDARRDHSMRVPRPDLSVTLGTPNACNMCHIDQDAQWALNSLRQWGTDFRDTSTHKARTFARFDMGDRSVVPRIAGLANDVEAAPIWRATALETLGQAGGREALQAVTSVLYDDDPIIRASAVRALEFLPLHQRYQLLQALMDDEVASVRMNVATSLAGVPLDRVSPEQAEALLALFDWYKDLQSLHTDMPETHIQLGLFHSARGDFPSAEKAYREAIYLNPQLVPAYLNLADQLRVLQRDEEARKLLLTVLGFAPGHGPTLHALGLLETRSGDPENALAYLKQAAEVEAIGTRHRFVYAIALHDLGQPEQAIKQLQSLLRVVPRNEDVLLALANYSAELGERSSALSYVNQLLAIAPNNPSYQQLQQQLRQ